MAAVARDGETESYLHNLTKVTVFVFDDVGQIKVDFRAHQKNNANR
jgi:hypothetical protein